MVVRASHSSQSSLDQTPLVHFRVCRRSTETEVNPCRSSNIQKATVKGSNKVVMQHVGQDRAGLAKVVR